MKPENNWKYKSLMNLQKVSNPTDKENFPSRPVKRFVELLSIPLNEYTTEDLRLMIGQQFGLAYLIPLAIEHLENNLFAEGDFFPGDLLSNVLSIDPAFWKENRDLQQQVSDLIKHNKNKIAGEGISISIFENNL